MVSGVISDHAKEASEMQVPWQNRFAEISIMNKLQIWNSIPDTNFFVDLKLVFHLQIGREALRDINPECSSF